MTTEIFNYQSIDTNRILEDKQIINFMEGENTMENKTENVLTIVENKIDYDEMKNQNAINAKLFFLNEGFNFPKIKTLTKKCFDKRLDNIKFFEGLKKIEIEKPLYEIMRKDFGYTKHFLENFFLWAVSNEKMNFFYADFEKLINNNFELIDSRKNLIKFFRVFKRHATEFFLFSSHRIGEFADSCYMEIFKINFSDFREKFIENFDKLITDYCSKVSELKTICNDKMYLSFQPYDILNINKSGTYDSCYSLMDGFHSMARFALANSPNVGIIYKFKKTESGIKYNSGRIWLLMSENKKVFWLDNFYGSLSALKQNQKEILETIKKYMQEKTGKEFLIVEVIDAYYISDYLKVTREGNVYLNGQNKYILIEKKYLEDIKANSEYWHKKEELVIELNVCPYCLSEGDYAEIEGCCQNDNIVTCDDCGCRIDTRNDDYNSIDGGYVCESCIDNYQYCEYCGDYHNNNMQWIKLNGEKYERYICENELRHYTCCNCCGEYWIDEKLFEIDGKYFCPGCYEEKTTICFQCDEVLEYDDINTLRHEGYYYCRDCYNELIEKEKRETQADFENLIVLKNVVNECRL